MTANTCCNQRSLVTSVIEAHHHAHPSVKMTTQPSVMTATVEDAIGVLRQMDVWILGMTLMVFLHLDTSTDRRLKRTTSRKS